MGLLILYVSLAVGFSFACSVMEAVLLSITPGFVAMLESQGKKSAPRIRKLKDNIDRPLSAILSLNTIAHTAGAALAGEQAARVFADKSFWIFSAVAVFSALLIALILVVSEIIPKTLGATYWKQLASPIAYAIQITVWLLFPLVVALELVTKVFGRGHAQAHVSREEIRALTTLGTEQGIFEEEEGRILKSLFRFRNLRAKDVMTPRTVIIAKLENTTVGEIMEEYERLPFSRIPLYQDSLDGTTGYVLKDQVLYEAAKGRLDKELKELIRPLMVFPAIAHLTVLFDRMINEREHIALVVDEYGGTSGIVTMEDVVETLLGLEIMDEADSISDLQAHARKNWASRARALGIIPDEDEILSPSIPENQKKIEPS